jgi:molybdate transport system substrate-binding protein
MQDRRTVIGWMAVIAAMGAVPVAAQPREPLTVFAAASLTDALQEVGRAWTKRSGQPVRFSFASSGTAARQIIAGAPADLFVAAETDWMDQVAAAGQLMPGARRDLLGGRLVLIAPAASRVRLTIRPGFALAAALGREGRLAVGDPRSVPAGRYAQAALTRLGVWASVATRLAPAQDVRAALSYVTRGETPFGIVYETDAAAAASAVRVVGVFPAASHPPIVYPAAVVKDAKPGAVAFYRYLGGAEATAIFRRYRFRPAR